MFNKGVISTMNVTSNLRNPTTVIGISMVMTSHYILFDKLWLRSFYNNWHYQFNLVIKHITDI